MDSSQISCTNPPLFIYSYANYNQVRYITSLCLKHLGRVLMANKAVIKFSLISGLSIGSFLAGSYIERYKQNQASVQVRPCLPIFGTVSAATSITSSKSSSTIIGRVSQIMKYGFPGMDHIRSYDDFVLSYDRKNRVPHWVFEHLCKANLTKNKQVDRSSCDFKQDESIHPYFRSENTDYKRSGYDRGHLAAAGNHKLDQKHVEQTFYLSNMAPQVGVGFNRDSWNRLEKYVRKLTNTYANVYCCTGPLYLPKREGDGKKYIKYEVIGANNVAVPTHFFKILVAETSNGEFEMEAYVMPNQVIDNNVPLTNFQVPPESIERAAGLLFFDNLSKNKICKVNGKKN